jgi:hypothetical protein
VLRLARLEDGDHVGVLDRRLQPAFASKARDELGIPVAVAGEHLQGDPATLLGVPGAVHRRHPTPPEDPLDDVGPHHCSRVERH